MNLTKHSLVFAFLVVCLSSTKLPVYGNKVDHTMTENASGVHVVDAVIWKLRNSGIFPEDYNLLRRLAWFQTQFGEAGSTTTNGGIWGLSETAFTSTINSIQPQMVTAINSAFDITWNRTEVIYTDCALPLVSGLAASIHIALNREDLLLQAISDQGNFLLDHSIIQNATAYAQEVDELEAGIACRLPFDITLLIGGSASQNSNFQNTTALEKEFTKGLFASFEKSNTYSRFSLVAVNGDSVEIRFPLNSPHNSYEIQRLVDTTGFSNLTDTNLTRINEEIKVGANTMNGTQRAGARVPRVLVTFSQRESSEDGGVSNIAYARQLGLQTHAITISPNVGDEHERELLNLAEQKERNVWRTDAIGLPELYRQFSKELCNLQLEVISNTVYSGRLAINEKRYHYIITDDNLDYTLHFVSDPGSDMTAYFSYSVENPSSAIHEYNLTVSGGEVFLPHAPSGTARIHVTIQNTGTQDLAYYSLVLQYHAYVPTTQAPTPPPTEAPTSSQPDTSTRNAGIIFFAPSSFIISVGMLFFLKALL